MKSEEKVISELTVEQQYNIAYMNKPLEIKRIITMILLELEAAERKHPDPWARVKGEYSHLYAAAIVSEESGELIQASMQHQHEGLERSKEMLKEAAQTGAMCIRFIKNTLIEQNKKPN